jgi:hypothetical protein
VGIMPAPILFTESIKILIDKCTKLEEEISKLAASNIAV